MDIRLVARPHDLDALARLFTVITDCDGHAPLGEHKYLDLLHAEPDQITGLVAEDAAGVVGYVALGPTQEMDTWALEFAIHPLHRHHKTTLTMVEAGVDWVEAKGGRTIRVWAFQPNLAEVLEECGFTPERELRQLRRTLPAHPAPVFPPGIRVAAFRPGQDEARWLAVNNAAFAGHPENGSWTREVLDDRMEQPWFDPDGFRMAWDGDLLAGFCWTKVHESRLGEIYVIGVHPARQGSGMGRALTLEGMRFLREEAGLSKVMLYVDARNEPANALYDRLGFRLDHVDRSFVRFVGR
jgi:mycothiol synthase